MTLPHCQTTAKSLPTGTLLPVLPAPIYKAQQLAVGVAAPRKHSTTHYAGTCPHCWSRGKSIPLHGDRCPQCGHREGAVECSEGAVCPPKVTHA